jgi:hypothetical protein
MLDEWELRSLLADLWISVVSQKSGEAAVAARAYDLVKSEAAEARHLGWRTDDKLVSAMKAQFRAEHGEDAVPVGSMPEAREMEALGAKPVVVTNTLKEILAKSGISAAATKSAKEGEVSIRLGPSDLTEKERGSLAAIELITRKYVIVEFRGPAACRSLDDDKVLGIDRRLLMIPMRSLVLTVAKGEAARRHVDGTDVLVEALMSTEQGAIAAAGREDYSFSGDQEAVEDEIAF